jgi:hypothetical protein
LGRQRGNQVSEVHAIAPVIHLRRKGVTMDFFELIQSRYSVRAYKSDPVEEEKLQRILEAAQLAPPTASLFA